MSARVVSLIVMFALVIASAISVVYSKHLSRKYFVELQAEQSLRDDLNVEWGRLQLEEGTLTDHGRIDQLVRERLGMLLPNAQTTVIIKP